MHDLYHRGSNALVRAAHGCSDIMSLTYISQHMRAAFREVSPPCGLGPQVVLVQVVQLSA